MDQQSSSLRRTILYTAGILLIIAVYANSLSNSFHFDDSHVIESNACIRSLRNTPRFFTDAHSFSSLPANATYRPLVSLSLALDYALGKGLQPRQFHVTQIALLLLLFVLTATFFRALLEGTFENAGQLAVIAATWFAVHTANTETMNLISARSELLAAIGVVGSLLLFVRSPMARKWHLHLLPMIGGILSKATAAIYAPLLFLDLLLFDEPPSSSGRIRRAAIQSTPAFVVAAATLMFVSHMNAPEWTSGGGDRLHYVQTQAWITLHYLRLFFLPIGLSADTDLTLIAHWYDTRIIAGIVAIIVLLFVAVRMSRDRSTRPIAFGLFWFILTLLPSALFPLAEVANEHRIFLPYIGLALAVTCGAQIVLRRVALTPHVYRIAAAILIAIVIGGNAIGTFQRNKTWRTEESLWLDVTRKSPGNGRALMNYGLTLMAKGELPRARDYFERAALLTPNYSTLEINRGIVNAALGDTVEAELHLRRALDLHDDADSRFFYARWLAENGRAVEAIVHLERAIVFSPAAINPRRLLMNLYVAAGERERLQRIAAETLSIDSSDELAGRYAASRPAFPPEVTDASLFHAGLVATQGGRHLDAAVAYRNSLALNSRSADTWHNLGWELAALGLRTQAEEAYQATLRIDPAYERARNNLVLLQRR
jgi:tetratricopeptide (TPR) repeat protein